MKSPRQWLSETFKSPRARRVAELIGRTFSFTEYWRYRAPTIVDRTRTDYMFYDRLRRGKAQGFELSGMIVQPATAIKSAFVLDKEGFSIALNDEAVDGRRRGNVQYTNDQLSDFTRSNHATFLNMIQDLSVLGDQFVFINPDGTLTIPSPETVQVKFDPLDYRIPISYTIKTVSEESTIEDTWTDTMRTVVVKNKRLRPTGGYDLDETTFTYPNLLGRIPVVHFANKRSGSETYGRSDFESSLRMLARYDVLFEKLIDGLELHGNPIPTLEGLKDIQETINANATSSEETYIDDAGVTEQRTVMRFDRMPVILVGEGGSFKFSSPIVGFSTDILNGLRALFTLYLNAQHTPEVLYGGSRDLTRPAAEAQMPPFIAYCESMRTDLEGTPVNDAGYAERGGLYQLFDLWLRVRRISDPRIVVSKIDITWSELSIEDDKVRLQKLIYMYSQGLLSPETALETSRLVNNPGAELERAKRDQELRRELNAKVSLEQQQAQTALNTAAHQDMDPEREESPNENVPRENPAGGEPASRQVGELTVAQRVSEIARTTQSPRGLVHQVWRRERRATPALEDREQVWQRVAEFFAGQASRSAHPDLYKALQQWRAEQTLVQE